MLKSIVFDFDGTLAYPNADEGRCVGDFSRSYGLDTWDAKKLFSYYTDPQHHDLGWGVPLNQQAAILQDYFKYATDNFEDYPEIHPVLHAGVADMLNTLAMDRHLYLATMRDRHTMNVTLDKNGIAHFFDKRVTITCIDEIGGLHKPAADMIHFLTNRHELCPDNACVVGDTVSDIQMGQAAGLMTIGITHGSHDEDRLRQAKPDHIVHSIPDLKHLLLTL